MSAPQLYSLVYRSRAAVAFDESDLVLLLERAREQNRQRGITGLLLFSAGQFIQVLEGPQGVVLDLFGQIARDARHCEVSALIQGPIAQRSMPEWSMGFSRSEPEQIEALPGFSRFLEGESLEGEGAAAWSARLLELFKSSADSTRT